MRAVVYRTDTYVKAHLNCNYIMVATSNILWEKEDAILDPVYETQRITIREENSILIVLRKVIWRLSAL